MDKVNNASRKIYDLRSKRSAEIIQFERAVEMTGSQRAASKMTKISRSTAQGRIARRNERTLPLATQEFLDTVEGMMFLHRIILAVEFIISQIAGAGIRVIQLFLEHTQLDQWVASSYGSVNKRVDIMEKNLIQFGQEQESLLRTNMREKSITGCLDETFPSGICLVAIEPISNFVLLEKQVDDRTSMTWKTELDNRLKDLPVKFHQITADKASALVKLAEQELSAHYSPDLFHIQQDLSKATSAPLARKVAACENALKAAEQELNQIAQEQEDYASQPVKPVGRPVDYAGRIHEANVKLATVQLDLEEAEARRKQVRESIKSLGDINLQIPKARDAAHKRELKASLSKLQSEININATWLLMDKRDKCRYEEKALECAHTFQRSTSNVEGRNGCLSLHHHSFRQMNERKLQAATVVHNYFIKRPGQTTAAERFLSSLMQIYLSGSFRSRIFRPNRVLGHQNEEKR